MQIIFTKRNIYLFRNTIRYCTVLKDIIPEIKIFSKYNIKYIDRIEIKIYNPNTVSQNSIFRNNTYNSTIWFIKNDMTIYKNFDDNNFEKMVNKINIFIENEIKI